MGLFNLIKSLRRHRRRQRNGENDIKDSTDVQPCCYSCGFSCDNTKFISAGRTIFDLPLEIRELIYLHYFGMNGGSIRPCSIHHKGANITRMKLARMKPDTPIVPLLHTSRAIEVEALTVLYSHHEFAFYDEEDQFNAIQGCPYCPLAHTQPSSGSAGSDANFPKEDSVLSQRPLHCWAAENDKTRSSKYYGSRMPHSDYYHMRDWLERIGPTNRSLLRRLRLHFTRRRWAYTLTPQIAGKYTFWKVYEMPDEMGYSDFGGPYLEAGLMMLGPNTTLQHLRITFSRPLEAYGRGQTPHLAERDKQLNTPEILTAMGNSLTANRRLAKCLVDFMGLRSFSVEVSAEMYDELDRYMHVRDASWGSHIKDIAPPSLVVLDRRVRALKKEMRLPYLERGNISAVEMWDV